MVLVVLLAAAGSSALAIGLSLPWLQRYALARPNARSSHAVPTPQGGGWAVVAATLALAGIGIAFGMVPAATPAFGVIAGGALALAVVSAWDDVRPLDARVRLAVHLATVALALAVLAPGVRLFPDFVPAAIEWPILLLAGVWFVNLTNFMDGLDWLTVAEMLPVTLAIAAFGLWGVVDPLTTVLAAALAGGLIGFAPFNRPVARLFLGDVGAVPIGFLVACLLFALAAAGEWAAALSLPLYYWADATITLLRRIARRERFWEAHRSHFYQQAVANGFDASRVARRVFGLNLALAALAAGTIGAQTLWVDLVALAIGGALVVACLFDFARPRAVS